METTWWTQPEQLDEAQKEVVALKENSDHLIIGPPGSGKTNLLILRAAHLYASGMKNICVLTFGRVLREFLAIGTGNYEFPADKIQTYVKWGSRLLALNDEELSGAADFKQLRPKLLDQLKVLSSQHEVMNQFDCILIDEVQDYTPQEIDVIRSFGKRLFAVGDDRQRIYESSGTLEALQSFIPSVKHLPYHYRNGIKICRVADGIRNLVDSPEGLESSSNYDESKFPSTVIDRSSLSVGAQVAAAIPDIQTQLRAYPDGMVGVLCPRHKELEEVWTALSTSELKDAVQLQRYSDGYVAFEPERRVVVATTHGAKGLEFRALHLLGMDKIARFSEKQRNLAYTAVTRAKTSLTIYHEDSLPGYLERGLFAAVGGLAPPPKLGSLFKKPR
jgi:superfamily I DNA/RNA helicase